MPFDRIVGLVLLALAAGTGRLCAQSLTDLFANRQTLTSVAGRLDDSNVGATLEPDEPRHGGRPGGSSVWISWLAPSDGIATFSTDGSDFDTLLAAYYFEKPEETTLDKLKEAARNDDAPGQQPTSLIQIGARAGILYHLAVDGYRGAAGSIRLRWDFVPAASPPPIIVSVPEDRAARQGDTVTLTVDMQVTPELDLQWRFNGNSFGARGPTVVIPSLQPENVGLYSLRIRIDDVRFETPPTEVQINSEGQTNALARDKLFDAIESPLTLEDDDNGNAGRVRLMDAAPAGTIGVSRGYKGTQIFNTTFATTDPSEPAHCGSAAGATYWFAYQPPADGTLEVDTIGSSYPALIAAYTYTPPLAAYTGLIPVACGAPTADGSARVEFATLRARPFFVVVGSLTGLRGIVHLNYRLDTNRPPQAPLLSASPVPHELAVGSSLTLEAAATGSPPLLFTWFRDDTVLPGQTTPVLILATLQPADSGQYRVRVENYLGQALSPPMLVRVLIPPRLQFQATGEFDRLSFLSATGQVYALELVDSVSTTNWLPLGDPVVGDGSLLGFTNAHPVQANGFYRLRVR